MKNSTKLLLLSFFVTVLSVYITSGLAAPMRLTKRSPMEEEQQARRGNSKIPAGSDLTIDADAPASGGVFSRIKKALTPKSRKKAEEENRKKAEKKGGVKGWFKGKFSRKGKGTKTEEASNDSDDEDFAGDDAEKENGSIAEIAEKDSGNTAQELHEENESGSAALTKVDSKKGSKLTGLVDEEDDDDDSDEEEDDVGDLEGFQKSKYGNPEGDAVADEEDDESEFHDANGIHGEVDEPIVGSVHDRQIDENIIEGQGEVDGVSISAEESNDNDESLKEFIEGVKPGRYWEFENAQLEGRNRMFATYIKSTVGKAGVGSMDKEVDAMNRIVRAFRNYSGNGWKCKENSFSQKTGIERKEVRLMFMRYNDGKPVYDD